MVERLGVAPRAPLYTFLDRHGREADTADVEEVQGVLSTIDRDLAEAFPLDARVGTERLKQTRLLVQHRSGRYSFRNAILREAVAQTVPEAQIVETLIEEAMRLADEMPEDEKIADAAPRVSVS